MKDSEQKFSSVAVSFLPLDSLEPLAKLLERLSDRYELLFLGGWLAVGAKQAFEQASERYLDGTLVIVVGTRAVLQEAQQGLLLGLALRLLSFSLLLLEFLNRINM